MMNLTLIFLLISCLVMMAPAMFFDLSQQREKCIIEEVPEDTLVTGTKFENTAFVISEKIPFMLLALWYCTNRFPLLKLQI